jgi:hypothetical protein
MVITFLIAGSFFAALMAIGYFGFQQAEKDRELAGTALYTSAPAAHASSCGVCNAPLRRAATSDEVVFEVEHRIDAELRDISHALHSAPESFGRILRA